MSIIQDYLWLHRGGGSGKPEESKTIALDMATGDQTVTPSEGKTLSSVTVQKPDTLIPANVRDGVDIGGVTGEMVGAKPEETGSATPTEEEQTITPPAGKVFSAVTVGAIQTEQASITANGSYTPSAGKYFNSVTVAIAAWDGTSTAGYTVTATATNCTIEGGAAYDGVIKQGGTLALSLAADGVTYVLPESITVTGATGTYTRTSDTAGTLVLSAATGDVSFNVVGEEILNGYDVYVSNVSSFYVGQYVDLSFDGGATWQTMEEMVDRTFENITQLKVHFVTQGRDYGDQYAITVTCDELSVNLESNFESVNITTTNFTLTSNVSIIIDAYD